MTALAQVIELRPSVQVKDDGELYTSSRTVAEVFGKQHYNVIRDIEQLDCSTEFRALNFEGTSYVTIQGILAAPKEPVVELFPIKKRKVTTKTKLAKHEVSELWRMSQKAYHVAGGGKVGKEASARFWQAINKACDVTGRFFENIPQDKFSLAVEAGQTFISQL